MCLRGVSELQESWLSRTDDPEVAVYVVWSSQLGAEARHVPDATTLMPDSRARHYWDPERLAGELFQPMLQTPGAAWDVWLLFDRDARWTRGGIPDPAWWEHQLGGMPPERRLDPERFAERALGLQRAGARGDGGSSGASGSTARATGTPTRATSSTPAAMRSTIQEWRFPTRDLVVGGRPAVVTPGGWGGANLVFLDSLASHRLRRVGERWVALDGSDTTLVFSAFPDPDAETAARDRRRDASVRVEVPSTPDYVQTEVRYSSDVPLAGTVLRPAAATGPVPGVVIIHGSGTSDRDNVWAFAMADVVARNGIAVLFPDKRGSGQSEGDWRDADFDLLAADALAGVRHLRSMPGVDPDRIGVLGLSQGGHVAPRVAAENPDEIAFVVSVVAAAVPMSRGVVHEIRSALESHGVPEPTIERLLDFHHLSARYARTGEGWEEYERALEELLQGPLAPAVATYPTDRSDPYWTRWRLNGDDDPMDDWRRVPQPVLAVFGEEDENVPTEESVRRLRRGLADAGHPDHTIRVLAGAGHGLFDPEAPGRRLHPEFVDLLVTWLSRATVVQDAEVGAADTVRVEVGAPILVSGDRPEISHVEPHLAVNPDEPDHLLAAVAVLPDSTPHWVDAFISFDGGKTWERKTLPGLSDTESLDPWVAFGGKGRAVVTALVHHHEMASSPERAPAAIATFRSGDGGRSWQGPYVAPYGLGASYDQQKVGADHSGGPYHGRLYIAAFHWGPRTVPGDLRTAALGVLASDNGATFRGPHDIRPNNVDKSSAQPVVLSDGTLVLLHREWGLVGSYERTDLLWAVHSTDGGTSFSPPFLVSAWASPGFVDAAVAVEGPWTDRVYASWLEDTEPVAARTSAAEFQRDAPRSLTVAYSDQRGMEWSSPVKVRTTSAGTALITHRVAVDGEGSVAAAWVETRERTGPEGDEQCHDWFVSVSSDGGSTFSAPHPIGEPACHPLPGGLSMYTMGHQVSPILPRFGRGGDYFGLVGVSGGGFRIMWSAAEDGIMRLWTAPIEVAESG